MDWLELSPQHRPLLDFILEAARPARQEVNPLSILRGLRRGNGGVDDEPWIGWTLSFSLLQETCSGNR